MSGERVETRPPSAVSHGVGVAGLAGLLAWVALALSTGMNGPFAALANVFFCGLPMALWSLLVDKVHRNPSTGIDWDRTPPPVSAIAETSMTKLAGLWATWALIAVIYGLGRWYWQGNALFAMQVFGLAALPLFILSIPYVVWLDRKLIEPRDGAWHLGALMMGKPGVDRAAIASHLRSWAVKGFFLAFMISIVPGGFREVIDADFAIIQADPVALARWLISLMFVIDVAFATVGYLLTLRPLDAHIRSATPYASGWVAALICYPPFILMDAGGPLDYHPGSADWVFWLQGHPVLLTLTGFILVALTAVYAWATVAFGLRFSNLTDRGILTHGPYAWTKHPAYLSKNLFWWIAGLPFLVTSGNPVDAIRNTALLAIVSGIYYWRAKTEEKHLASNPDYAPYAAWMARHGPITRRLTPGSRNGDEEQSRGASRPSSVGEGDFLA
jgi:Isoprenylcysteine carboxyl methyltransferase (ICMT) family